MDKRCCTCKELRSLSEFGFLRSAKDGRAKRCKPCSRNAIRLSKRKHYVAHPKQRKSDEYYKSKRREYYQKNKTTLLARILEWQRNNPGRVNAKNAAWRNANPEKAAQYFQDHKARHPGRRAEQRRAWKKANPHAVTAAVALRRAQKLQATPKWANRFFMREAYDLAKRRTAATGFKWEVDHYYPLQSDVVCGLHVEHNLRVIPAVLNRAKGNKVVAHG